MTIDITMIYIACLGMLIVVLGAATVVVRAKTGFPWGDGGNATLVRAIRAHGNLIEYAPIFLILMLVLEASGTAPTWLHALGVTFVVSRLISAAYFWFVQAFALRVIALWGTLLPIAVAAVLCIFP